MSTVNIASSPLGSSATTQQRHPTAKVAAATAAAYPFTVELEVSKRKDQV